jgi:hypothetical protein
MNMICMVKYFDVEQRAISRCPKIIQAINYQKILMVNLKSFSKAGYENIIIFLKMPDYTLMVV